MWTKELFEARIAAFGFEAYFWGRLGQDAVTEVEKRLEMTLSDDLRQFGESIGAVSIEGIQIILTGNNAPNGCEWSAVTETQRLWADQPETSRQLVVIGHWYEDLYCWSPTTTSIRRYHRPFVEIHKPDAEWESLDATLMAEFARLKDALSGEYEMEFRDTP